MRETMKNLIKNTITSIGIALTVFCVTGMVFDIANFPKWLSDA